MKYFVSKENVALYNLSDEECEVHTLNDGRTGFIIEASDEKLRIWQEANENRMVETDSSEIALNSVQLAFNKERIKAGAKDTLAKNIESKYPLYKQNNINNLQGYSESDKVAMWEFINTSRDELNSFRLAVQNATTLKQLKTIEEK